MSISDCSGESSTHMGSTTHGALSGSVMSSSVFRTFPLYAMSNAPLFFSQTDRSSRANTHPFVFPEFCLAESLSKLAG